MARVQVCLRLYSISSAHTRRDDWLMNFKV